VRSNQTVIFTADERTSVAFRSLKRALRRSSGFTLVEILTAIGIISILAALLILGINHVSARAKTDKTRTVLASLKGMLTEFETKGGRMRMVDRPYFVSVNGGKWQMVKREVAPKGKVNSDDLATVVKTPEFERTRRVVQALLSMQANQTVINNLPEDVRMKDPPVGGTGESPVTAPVLLDAWGNPILYAPRKVKPWPNPEDPPNPATDLPPDESKTGDRNKFKWGLQGLFIKANPGQEYFYEPTDGKGMFVSAGPDGDFSTADDNIYSDDSGKVYTDLLSKKN
jgi:prepilin-type N-terminal cleavage/methylation domain-containing protein